MALIGQPGDQIVYPANAVAKRWESRELGFFRPLFDAFAELRRQATQGN
jgi:hypothetical protein